MADAMQGIMGLPQGPMQGPAQGETLNPALFSPAIESYAKTDPVGFGNDILGSLEQADPGLVQQLKAFLQQAQLPLEILDAMGKLVDLVLGNPDRYQEIRADMLTEGVPEELLPEEFDPAFFAALNIALDQIADASAGPMPGQEPLMLARGGIAELNPMMQSMARMGRGEDKMLAHITPSEARMLRMRGGRGSINPSTGLPEFGFFSGIGKAIGGAFKSVGNAVKSAVKSVGRAVKSFASSTIGRIILTAAAVWFMGPAGLNLAGGLGLTGATALGVNTFAASTLVGVASGQKLGDALKTGAISGLLAGGAGAVFGTPPGYGPKVDLSAPPTGAPVGAGASTGTVAPAAGTTGPVVGPNVGPITPATPMPVPAPSLDIKSLPMDALDDLSPNFVGPRVPLPAAGTEPFIGAGQAAPTGVPASIPASPSIPPTMPDISPNFRGLQVSGVTQGPVAPAAQQGYVPSEFVRGAVGNAGTAPATPPGFLDSIKGGNFTDAAKAAWRNISPSEIQKTGMEEAIASVQQQYPGLSREAILSAPANSQVGQMLAAAKPGVLSTYGPMVAAGMGIMGLMGGFKTPSTPMPRGFGGPTGQDLLEKYPEKYGLNFAGTRTAYGINPYDYMYSSPPPMQAATGGIASMERYAAGGMPQHFPRKTGPINGPGTGTSDSIPAMLSDGEFVLTAKAVRGAGGGSRRAGAKKLYALMKALERKV